MRHPLPQAGAQRPEPAPYLPPAGNRNRRWRGVLCGRRGERAAQEGVGFAERGGVYAKTKTRPESAEPASYPALRGVCITPQAESYKPPLDDGAEALVASTTRTFLRGTPQRGQVESLVVCWGSTVRMAACV